MSAADQMPQAKPGTNDDILLSVRNIKKHFPIREGALQKVVGQVRAVDGVSFDIRRGMDGFDQDECRRQGDD